MLTISRETDYACRVILHLAMSPADIRVTAQEIAKKRIIPRALVRRVITRLGKAKLIKTMRGKRGGLALARSAAQISLLDVVEAMEGTIALNVCLLENKACPLIPVCPVHEGWDKARRLLRAELARATFDKLATRGYRLNKRNA